MRTSVETLDGLERKITVVLPVEDVQKVYDKKLSEISKTVKLDGFRPGKAPRDVIERKYGSEICQDVASQLIEDSFPKVIEELKLQIAGRPEVDLPNPCKKDQPLEYTANVEVFPEIALVELAGQKIELVKAELVDEDMGMMLEKIQKQFAQWSPVERAAQEGDQVVIDFEGFLGDEPFEGGKAEEYSLELGSKSMIPGFEEGIIGIKAGETRDIQVTFPEQYSSETLSGKEATFKIKAHKVQAAELPALDDALAEKMGVSDGIEGLKQEVRRQMELELERVIEARNKATVLDKLIELNPIPLPQGLVNVEIDHMQNVMKQQMSQQAGGQSLPDTFAFPREMFLEQAERRVRLGLLLSEVIKKYELKVSEEKVQEKIQSLASSYQKADEVVAWYNQNKQMKSEIEAATLEEAAVDKLIESSEKSEKTISYQEAMKQPDENEEGSTSS